MSIVSSLLLQQPRFLSSDKVAFYVRGHFSFGLASLSIIILHFICIILPVVSFFGEGNGTPLQYSCLENPMDGGAWWAAVPGVAKSGA